MQVSKPQGDPNEMSQTSQRDCQFLAAIAFLERNSPQKLAMLGFQKPKLTKL